MSEGHELHPVKNAWRLFELGSTRCIGEELAMMEMKLAVAFTVRDLEFDFNYTLWKEMKRGESGVASEVVDGQPAYRLGFGMGRVKDGLPVRYGRARFKLAADCWFPIAAYMPVMYISPRFYLGSIPEVYLSLFKL